MFVFQRHVKSREPNPQELLRFDSRLSFVIVIPVVVLFKLGDELYKTNNRSRDKKYWEPILKAFAKPK